MTRESINGACHCGKVRFSVKLTDGFNTIRRCTCSYCRMRGAVAVSANLADIEILSGGEGLTLYEFGTRSAKHFFCSTCGIYTHHQRRSNPHQYGVNVACLEGISPFDFAEVPVLDGVNHPKDAKATGPRMAGVLRFEPSPDCQARIAKPELNEPTQDMGLVGGAHTKRAVPKGTALDA